MQQRLNTYENMQLDLYMHVNLNHMQGKSHSPATMATKHFTSEIKHVWKKALKDWMPKGSKNKYDYEISDDQGVQAAKKLKVGVQTLPANLVKCTCGSL